MRGQADDTVNIILGECPKLAQEEYKRRHHRIHWEVCRKFRFNGEKKWQEYTPKAVEENDSHMILSDFSIQTNDVTEAQRPDLIVISKESSKCRIIDFAIPYDTRVDTKKTEKIKSG